MTFSAVLLAGGASSRMGRDKATSQFRSVPLWRNQLDLLRKLKPAQLFVSAQTDPPWRPANVEFVGDTQPSRGPMSGIAAAVSRISTDHLLVLGIDMPFMSADYLRELAGKIGPNRGVVPFIDNRGEPLAAVYPRTADVDLVTALNGRDFSLQSLIRALIASGKLQPVRVAPEERSLFRNLNEPADLESS